MPVLFVGHGSPMNAIERNAYSQAWEKMGRNLPRPETILCVSAHIVQQDHQEILALLDRREEVRLAIPTAEHFLPLLYCLAVREKDDELSFFTEDVTLGSISMRSIHIHSAQD